MVVGVAPNGTGDRPGHPGGVPGPGLSDSETVAHMSLWCDLPCSMLLISVVTRCC